MVHLFWPLTLVAVGIPVAIAALLALAVERLVELRLGTAETAGTWAYDTATLV
jgi:hypothetical protein